MIVFISDIHFEDGTAGEHNLSADAFNVFFEDLHWHIQRRGIKEVKVVLLGDIFDLLRTEYWLGDGVPDSEKPWAWPIPDEAALQRHASNVLGRIVAQNKEALHAFREGLRQVATRCEAGAVYVPGNHDRLVNLFAPLRGQVRDALGIQGSGRFKPFFEDVQHAVHARHGHEFDPHNFEKVGSRAESDYDAMPIGDPITTEVLTRIPMLAAQRARESKVPVSDNDVAQLKSNLQDIENVRPLSATIEWLFYEIIKRDNLGTVIKEAIEQAISDFKALPFVDAWFDRHGTWRNPWDAADQLQVAFWALETLGVSSVKNLATLVEKVRKLARGRDSYVEAAASLYLDLDPNIRFIVMGHTHAATQQAIEIVRQSNGSSSSRAYLNSGTWRPRHHRCHRGDGFVDWKEMTYCIVYRPGEREGHNAATFETWSGTLQS